MSNRPVPNHLAAKPSICFVALKSYAVLTGDSSVNHIGGAEVQQSLIGRELARRGYRVSFVVLDHGQPDGIEIDGIRVFKAYRPEAGFRGLRFFHPRLTKLWGAMKRVDADIYYQRGAGAESGLVAIWCRRHGRVFVFAAASDLDCETSLSYLPTQRERMLYRFGIRNASRIIAQTRQQVTTFATSFGVHPVLILGCSEDAFDPACLQAKSLFNTRPRVLWIGRPAKEKRLEMLVELARTSPEYDFDVVGPRSTDIAFSALLANTAKVPNVKLIGPLPHHAIGRAYDRASLVVCTSLWEGYPNTFMEAWARAVPTVSTVDPDGVILANSLGAVADTVEGLKAATDMLLRNPRQWRDCAVRARHFFLEHHRVEVAVDRLERVIREVVHEHSTN
jgi:glycosyltransferase involved in cell wall biosynthesis